MLLGDGACSHGQAAAVRAQDVVNFVLRDELFGEFCRGIGIALVIVVNDLDIIKITADIDPAEFFVDIIRPQVISLADIKADRGVSSGLRKGCTNADRPDNLGFFRFSWFFGGGQVSSDVPALQQAGSTAGSLSWCRLRVAVWQ